MKKKDVCAICKDEVQTNFVFHQMIVEKTGKKITVKVCNRCEKKLSHLKPGPENRLYCK